MKINKNNGTVERLVRAKYEDGVKQEQIDNLNQLGETNGETKTKQCCMEFVINADILT